MLCFPGVRIATPNENKMSHRRRKPVQKEASMAGTDRLTPTVSEISDLALSSVSGRISYRIIRHEAIPCGRIDKAVAVVFCIHRFKK